jgi:hypothetical protein
MKDRMTYEKPSIHTLIMLMFDAVCNLSLSPLYVREFAVRVCGGSTHFKKLSCLLFLIKSPPRIYFSQE